MYEVLKGGEEKSSSSRLSVYKNGREMEDMKYDVLNPYKDYLNQKLSKNTAKKYYSCIVNLFQDIQFNNVSEIERNFVEEKILKFKTKNEFSAIKNALLNLKELYPDFDIPDDFYFKEASRKKKNWSKKPKKNIYLDQTNRKINQIKNIKMRLAFRLALVSGLRVSELSFLEAGDIAFEEGIITVNVKHGKGGSNGYVKCLPDSYLYKRLKEYTDSLEPGERLFYSESYMREKADELGLECHDFRRICAITYRNQLKKEMPVAEANIKVQELLRHKRFSTTKRYLYNRKLVFKKSKEEKDERKKEEPEKE